jgi:dynein heavy chain, axonemal
VSEVEDKLTKAEEKARLFNSREELFGGDMTDYESVGLIRKSFEPYSNLWATTQR